MRQIACAIVGLLVMCGCDGDYACVALCAIAAGLDVRVANAETGEAICDATVTASEGSYSEQLQPIDSGAACRYRGAFSRPGIYSVRAEREAFVPASVSNVKVVMGTGRCCPGIKTQTVYLRLSSAP